MSNRVLAHGVRAVFPVSFESVVNVVRGYDSASNIFISRFWIRVLEPQ